MNKHVFVFVVCGATEHIDTLHFSLERLKAHSKSEIWVVTDKSRNEIVIQHQHQIDVKTPEDYTNHQASIYLKTGLHLFLPTGNLYCYLDTDVIALSTHVDEIFNEFIDPIRFAPDHCSFKLFSAAAVKCGCELIQAQNQALFLEINSTFQKHQTDPLLIEKRKKLETLFQKSRSTLFRRITNQFKFRMSSKYFWLTDEFYFDKANDVWKDRNHSSIMYESYNREIEKLTKFRFDEVSNVWLDKDGVDIWLNECDHLSEAILETFGIKVENTDWQHWNGGVFLFSDKSHLFLEAWHEKCKKIFTLENWKTRDQGTLIANVWEFGLQNHPPLDKKWNFLADKNNKSVDFNDDGLFTDNSWESSYRVNFVHVYHSFGDVSWDLWNYILRQV